MCDNVTGYTVGVVDSAAGIIAYCVVVADYDDDDEYVYLGPINREMRNLISSLKNHNEQLKVEVQRYKRRLREAGTEITKVWCRIAKLAVELLCYCKISTCNKYVEHYYNIIIISTVIWNVLLSDFCTYSVINSAFSFFSLDHDHAL